MLTQHYLLFFITGLLWQTPAIKSQTLSPLMTANAQQATNSTIVVTCTFDVVGTANLYWTFNGMHIGYTAVNVHSNAYASRVTSPYIDRIGFRVQPRQIDESNNVLTSQLSIFELRPEENGFIIEVDASSSRSSIVLNITDCPQTLSNNVIVESSSNIFNAKGRFGCSNNGKLFYSNGNQLQSIETTCLASAKWSGQDNLQCWTAPRVVLNGDVELFEGDNVTLTCDYEDTIPAGLSSIFYIGDEAVVIQKGQPFTQTVEASDNNKQVSCKAVTPYTQIFNDAGRSRHYSLRVKNLHVFANVLASTQDYMSRTESGYLLRSDQNLIMSCSNNANETSMCRWSICDDQCYVLTNANNSCQYNQQVNRSGILSCEIYRSNGWMKSNSLNLTLIPVLRSVELLVFDTVRTNESSVSASLGKSVTVSCNIANALELNTTFRLILPTRTLHSGSYNIPSMAETDVGKYTCVTSDAFGSFEASVYIDVMSLPSASYTQSSLIIGILCAVIVVLFIIAGIVYFRMRQKMKKKKDNLPGVLFSTHSDTNNGVCNRIATHQQPSDRATNTYFQFNKSANQGMNKTEPNVYSNEAASSVRKLDYVSMKENTMSVSSETGCQSHYDIPVVQVQYVHMQSPTSEEFGRKMQYDVPKLANGGCNSFGKLTSSTEGTYEEMGFTSKDTDADCRDGIYEAIGEARQSPYSNADDI